MAMAHPGVPRPASLVFWLERAFSLPKMTNPLPPKFPLERKIGFASYPAAEPEASNKSAYFALRRSALPKGGDRLFGMLCLLRTSAHSRSRT